jgi:hypothetical protein
MKTWHWILIGTIIVFIYLIYRYRTKIPFVKNVVSDNIPDTFIRHDQFGKVTWSKVDGVYTYTLDYGMVAGVPQSTTLERFMEAYKS